MPENKFGRINRIFLLELIYLYVKYLINLLPVICNSVNELCIAVL